MGHRTENAELTVLCLIQDGNRVLLQNRVKNDWKGYTLPGGHVEAGESFVDAVVREMKNPRIVGIKHFPMENGRYIVLLFKTTEFEGTVVSSEEGEMEWISLDDLSAINVVEDFHDLMKVMNDPDLNEFQYTIENGEWIVHLK